MGLANGIDETCYLVPAFQSFLASDAGSQTALQYASQACNAEGQGPLIACAVQHFPESTCRELDGGPNSIVAEIDAACPQDGGGCEDDQCDGCQMGCTTALNGCNAGCMDPGTATACLSCNYDCNQADYACNQKCTAQ